MAVFPNLFILSLVWRPHPVVCRAHSALQWTRWGWWINQKPQFFNLSLCPQIYFFNNCVDKRFLHPFLTFFYMSTQGFSLFFNPKFLEFVGRKKWWCSALNILFIHGVYSGPNVPLCFPFVKFYLIWKPQFKLEWHNWLWHKTCQLGSSAAGPFYSHLRWLLGDEFCAPKLYFEPSVLWIWPHLETKSF